MPGIVGVRPQARWMPAFAGMTARGPEDSGVKWAASMGRMPRMPSQAAPLRSGRHGRQGVCRAFEPTENALGNV